MNPRRQRVKWRFAAERRRERNYALGLTSNGRPRTYRKFPELKGVPTAQRRMMRKRIYRAEWRAKGITARGTRRLGYRPPTSTMIAYLDFRATIPMPEIVFSQERWE